MAPVRGYLESLIAMEITSLFDIFCFTQHEGLRRFTLSVSPLSFIWLKMLFGLVKEMNEFDILLTQNASDG